jgi:hypothetical protein
MANYISIGHEFINLEYVKAIQVYTDTQGTVIACVESDDWLHEIPCAGTEEEVRMLIWKAIYRTCGSCEEGPVSP